MAIKEELAGISGAESVLDDAESLKAYSSDYSLNTPAMPSYDLRTPSDMSDWVESSCAGSTPILRWSTCIWPSG